MRVSPVRVLLIEDDEDDYILVRSALSNAQSNRYDLDWISSYTAGLEAIKDGDYDICLLDYRLGKHDGLSLLREANRMRCRTPIIFLTGHGSYNVDVEAMRAGAADYLVKGQFGADLLERAMRYAMERKKGQEELRDYAEKLQLSNDELSLTLDELHRTEEELRHQNRRLKATWEQLRYQNEALIRAQEAAEVEHQRYLDLFDYAPEGYLITDVQGTVMEANRAAAALLNVEREQVMGAPLERFVAEGSQEALDVQVDRLLRQKTLRNWEVQLQPQAGAPFFAELNAEAVLPRLGEQIALRWSIRDISQRKEAEELLKRSERELRLLSTRLLSAQEEERKKVACDLHDSIGSALSAIKYRLESTLIGAEKGEPVQEALQSLIALVQRTIDEARKMMSDLRPSSLDDLGIIPTIGWYCRQQREVYSSFHIEQSITLDEDDVPEPLKVVLFRIIQEAFHNIVKYSSADLVNLSLARRDSTLELIIRDNGVGFDTDSVLLSPSLDKGLGLTSMRERTELSGGTFALESQVGGGTIVRASWKLF